MKEIKLKTCPSCGSRKIKKYFDNSIHCLKCGYILDLNKKPEFVNFERREEWN